MGREVVTIVHPAPPDGVDEYGEPLPGLPSSQAVSARGIAPGASIENNRRQSTVEVAFTVYLDPGTVVEPDAKMVVRGQTFEVIGQPEDWISPFTAWHPGVVVELERAG